MARIGHALSSEEHAPSQLVENARAAEDAGFEFALISDHYHPGSTPVLASPFVWFVLGGIAFRLEVGGWDRRHLPDDPHPPGDHRPGSGHGRLHDAGPVLPRCRHR